MAPKKAHKKAPAVPMTDPDTRPRSRNVPLAPSVTHEENWAELEGSSYQNPNFDQGDRDHAQHWGVQLGSQEWVEAGTIYQTWLTYQRSRELDMDLVDPRVRASQLAGHAVQHEGVHPPAIVPAASVDTTHAVDAPGSANAPIHVPGSSFTPINPAWARNHVANVTARRYMRSMASLNSIATIEAEATPGENPGAASKRKAPTQRSSPAKRQRTSPAKPANTAANDKTPAMDKTSAKDKAPVTSKTPTKAKSPSKGQTSAQSKSSKKQVEAEDDVEEENGDGEEGDPRPFKCAFPGCGKAFKRREHLARHFNSKHDQAARWSCRGCGKTFSRKDNCTTHERSCAKIPAKDRPVPADRKKKEERNG